MVCRVVIVDDQLSVSSHISSIVRSIKGMIVIGQARDGLEGWIMVERLRPDIVLLDISMPVMNGLELARRIRGTSLLTAIVFVTIHEEESYQFIAELLQADAVVSKTHLTKQLPEVLKAIAKRLATAADRGVEDGHTTKPKDSQRVYETRKAQ